LLAHQSMEFLKVVLRSFLTMHWALLSIPLLQKKFAYLIDPL
jgi:hypothetical protein